jgi:MFS family permease
MNAPARGALLRQPGFRPFLAGAAMSNLGDQFTVIALPWLVLQLTGDPVALGLIIALMALPRAVLMLFGGALVDRYSPKRVLMLTKYANTILLGVLALLVGSGHATLPVVTGLALAMSMASAFAIPAGTSILPHVVAPELLAAANGTMMGVRQVALLAGPLLAGLLFALGGDGRPGHDMTGLALAFGVDCASFAVSAWTLSLVVEQPVAARPAEPVLRAVGAALACVWRDTMLRTGFIYWGLCACVIGGLTQVALPLLASTRLQGAASLGLLLGAHGAGSLAGMVLSGITGRRIDRAFGATLLAVDAAIGLLLPLLGLITAVWQGVLVNLAIGMLGGFVGVTVFTWIQQRVPKAMLGRMMSIFMFVVIGVAPLAAGGAGWLASRVPLPHLFTGAGIFMTGAAVLAWLFTPMGRMTRSTGAAHVQEPDRVA